MTLEKGWYLINDDELFLFASRGFWDREERMQYYRAVKARYCGKEMPQILGATRPARTRSKEAPSDDR